MAEASEAMAVTRAVEGVTLIFRGYDGLWMIDRVAAPANERGDEDLCDVGELDFEARDAGGWDADEDDFEGATAVALAELRGMTADERRSFHARQVRKLGLVMKGEASRLLWRLVSDPSGFQP